MASDSESVITSEKSNYFSEEYSSEQEKTPKAAAKTLKNDKYSLNKEKFGHEIQKINGLYDYLRLRSQNNEINQRLYENSINFDDLYHKGNTANKNHHRTDVRAKKILRACR